MISFIVASIAFLPHTVDFSWISEPTQQWCHPNYDLESDASTVRFISVGRPYKDVHYRPNDLEEILHESLGTTKSLMLRKEALASLERLGDQFLLDMGYPLTVASGYRSYDHQANIAKKRPDCVREWLCAVPGYSEHQSGLAVDLFDASTSEAFFQSKQRAMAWQWLTDNAHKYGWHQSYQRGRDTDGYDVEPWHWRYLGVELASELKKENLTFTQWSIEELRHRERQMCED